MTPASLLFGSRLRHAANMYAGIERNSSATKILTRSRDEVIISKKPTGTLILDDLKPGKNLFMFGTGTGLAPFMSLIKDPDVYERFEKVILVHGVRYVNELAYSEFIREELPNNEFFGEMVRGKLVYYPTVTREEFQTVGRITTLMENGGLCNDVGLPPLNPETDRAMICGSPSMLADIRGILDAKGFVVSPGVGEPGDYVFERAFVEK